MANGYTTGIGGVLMAWADAGVFAYVLPFLMIFAVVFGILSKSEILGDNKGVLATISLTVGLLALQFGYVRDFFATIFPYTGMGIAVLLIAFIFMGLIGKEGKLQWVWFGIGAIIFLVVLMASVDSFGNWFGGGFQGYGYDWPAIAAALLVLIVLGFIIWGGGKATGS